MVALSFLLMFALMYSMVNRFENVFANLNQFYMAGLMAMPMLILELVVMRAMYPSRTWNTALIVLGAIALGGFWIGIRQQVAVTDAQFLKSMIPHHAGAILMCTRAPIADPDIAALCKTIVTNQQAEIAQMQGMLRRLEND